MNTQIQKLLDLPQMINGLIRTGSVNTALDQYDSNAGVRHYTAFIYRWASFIGLISMEVSIINAAYKYFTAGGATGLAMVGSILTTLLLMASAFPIAHLIRMRGEALGSGHQGMVSFVFGDFIKTNIRLLGEIAAVTALFAALNQTLAFLLDNNLFDASSGSAMDALNALASLPMNLLGRVLDLFHLGMVSDFLSEASGFHMQSGGLYNGDFVWNIQDLKAVVGSYINVLVGLVFVYVNLAIYGYLYNLAATLIKWISSPSLPISLKNK